VDTVAELVPYVSVSGQLSETLDRVLKVF
jgi:hypothetical protein